jgi:hypothetical protein
MVEVVVAAGVYPALAFFCFSAADATSIGRRRIGIF